MSSLRRVVHVESGDTLVEKARWCDTFFTKLKGFSWRRELELNEALVLVEKRENRINTAIHMLFVFCDLGVLWVSSRGRVVDAVVARPWRLSYAPKAPALYVVEGHPWLVDQVEVGDHLRFVEITGG